MVSAALPSLPSLSSVSLEALTRSFEIVFAVAVVAGVLSLRWPLVGIALSAGVAVCVSRYWCSRTAAALAGQPFLGLAESFTGGPGGAVGPVTSTDRRLGQVAREASAGPEDANVDHAVLETRGERDRQLEQGVACRPPGGAQQRMFSQGAYAKAREEAQSYPGRVAMRLQLARNQEVNQVPVTNDARRAFMYAHVESMGNKASEYMVEVSGTRPCPGRPLDNAMEDAFDRRSTEYVESNVPPADSMPVVGSSVAGP
jgi:hypothetical protein